MSLTRGSAGFSGGGVLPASGGGSFVVDAPARPSGLAGEAADGAASLTWTDPARVADRFTGINVYKATVSGGPYTLAGTAAVAAQAATVSGLTNGTPYYFVVTATGPGGESGRSNEATVTPSA